MFVLEYTKNKTKVRVGKYHLFRCVDNVLVEVDFFQRILERRLDVMLQPYLAAAIPFLNHLEDGV